MEKFIHHLAIGAGKILLARFGKIRKLNTKENAQDFVTAADLASNKFIVKEIKRKFPNHGIISEEMGEYNKSAEWVWIVDPLDGTGNYANGIAIFTVLIALAHNGRVEYGIIYDPVHSEFFSAKLGHGAFLNGKRIRASTVAKLESSGGLRNSWMFDADINLFKKIRLQLKGLALVVAAYGSLGFNAAQVAAGRKDWLISSEAKIWDYAGASLILREAGCKVTNFSGSEWTLSDNQFIAANPILHRQILNAVKKS